VPPIAPPARPAGCPEPLSPPAGLRLQFGGFGTGPGEFDRPTDVAVGPGGVYVADQLNSRIQRFAPDGRYLGQWGGRPLGDVAPGPGQFLLPVGVAQAADGSVYVSDFGANRVQRFTADGAFVREWGGQGADDGEFDGMTGLTVDRDGFVYVADARNGRVQKFTADGAFVLKFGTRGTGSGQFSAPRGITTDAAGDVYVADRDNGRVQVYSPTGALLREWGRRGTSPGRFNGLYDVAIDGAGNVWTADLHNFRLQRFTPTGTLLGVENRFGSAPEDFDPWAVAVDAAGRIYAVDILGGTGDRILVFGP
jgi:tripartite motif-containing protein 71